MIRFVVFVKCFVFIIQKKFSFIYLLDFVCLFTYMLTLSLNSYIWRLAANFSKSALKKLHKF